MSLVPVHAPAWFLNYEACTLVELRQFVRDRSDVTPDADIIRKLRYFTKAGLLNRLRTMDRECPFSRFMDLPPEVRLLVFEELLIDKSERDKHGYIRRPRQSLPLYPAVLRTSKKVFDEAMPILYKHNDFRASIRCIHRVSRGAVGVLHVEHPGCMRSYNREMYGDHPIQLSRSLCNSSTMGMLRNLEHLTVDLSIATPRWYHPPWTFARASDAVATLCLALNSASRIDRLTVNVDILDSRANSSELRNTLWPLIFLRTDIVVAFKSQSALSRPSTVSSGSATPMSPIGEANCAELIARVRSFYRDRVETDNRDHSHPYYAQQAFDHLRHIVTLHMDTTDIVDLSPKWEAVRTHADRVAWTQTGIVCVSSD